MFSEENMCVERLLSQEILYLMEVEDECSLLSQLNVDQNFIPYLFKVSFNIILPFTSDPPRLFSLL